MALLQQGHTQVEIARRLGVTAGAVSQWKKAFQAEGPKGIAAKRHPGPVSRLTERQRKQLAGILLKGPGKQGYGTELWTLPRIAEVIQRRFGVTYDPSSVWHILRKMDWSCQKPERRARERDEERIARWRKQDWPRIKKARRSGRSIVLIDESGFMLQPLVRRTWAPRGKTPLHHSWDRHDRLSVITALSVSPKRRRLGLYFDIHDHNIRTGEVEAFVRWLRRRFPKGIILVMDRLAAHRSAARRLGARFGRSVAVEWLPPYAPELNPVEQVWGHTKYADLANFIPDDVAHLEREVIYSIEQTASDQTLLRAFFQHAKLGL